MERSEQRYDDELTTDLGAVTTETKGPGPIGLDIVGQRTSAGLSDD